MGSGLGVGGDGSPVLHVVTGTAWIWLLCLSGVVVVVDWSDARVRVGEFGGRVVKEDVCGLAGSMIVLRPGSWSLDDQHVFGLTDLKGERK